MPVIVTTGLASAILCFDVFDRVEKDIFYYKHHLYHKIITLMGFWGFGVLGF